MRLVHLSDLHLGYRQYQRLTPTGINQREWDVANTFRQAIDRIIGLKPDVVLVSGDVFHTSRPTNAAILHAFRQFARLRNELPDAAIVMVAGNHDTPRTTESGSIMALFEALDIRVAATEAQWFSFFDNELAILAVPDVPGVIPEFSVQPTARQNVLVIHADIDDVVPRYYAELDRAAIRLSRRDLGLEQWDYVALGHYHVHRRVAKNAFYAGSIDYTNLDIWYERGEEKDLHLGGKGFVEFNLDSGAMEFHALPASRDFVELRPINAREMSPAEVDAAIRRAVDREKGGIDDKVVRLVIRDIPRQVSRELDHSALREYKKRALSFVLDTRKPETSRRSAAGGPSRRPLVVEVVREQLTAR